MRKGMCLTGVGDQFLMFLGLEVLKCCALVYSLY